MTYLILVSHGLFAKGLHNTLKMFVGDRDDIFSVGLEEGMSTDAFVDAFNAVIEQVKPEDQVVLLGDLVGGSPLTNAINQVTEHELDGQTLVLGGMNLCMALTAALGKDAGDLEDLKEELLEESRNAIVEFPLGGEDSGDDDDI